MNGTGSFFSLLAFVFSFACLIEIKKIEAMLSKTTKEVPKSDKKYMMLMIALVLVTIAIIIYSTMRMH